ncbi:MAG: hypothetical protein M0P01_11295, partial [Treponema sp.]|nr:hypothetical protein [Treponema sp.]
QHLQSHKQEVLPASDENSGEEQKPENLIVEQLVSFDDISYDKHADVLYDLAAQAVAHLHSYLPSETEVYNVVHYYRRELAAVIHTQMVIQKQNNTVTTGYNAKITAGFTEIRNTAYTVAEDQNTLDIFDASFDRSKIKTIVFGNFHRCLYSVCKFDSDPERRFAAFLESDSSGCRKWFKPVKGQIGIHYRQPLDVVAASAESNADLLSDSEYVPDFIAEFPDVYMMAEVKAQNELTDSVVLAKKDAAVLWCRYASEHNEKSGQKPWIYLLIPDTEISDNRTLKYYLQFEGKNENT